ncbi:MAG: hypothetical protein KTR16_10035 [Acidiferrobacterales bacterium]|nr:hypothetical protein [Acidiferrobacterales bacterium]
MARLLLKLLTLSSVLLFCLMLSACERNNEPLKVEAVGLFHSWEFRYPGPDRVLHTGDDLFSQNNLFLPARTDIELELISKDFIYNFIISEFNQNQTAVPYTTFDLTFVTEEPAVYEMEGDKYCSIRKKLVSKVEVLATVSEFRDKLLSEAELQQKGKDQATRAKVLFNASLSKANRPSG